MGKKIELLSPKLRNMAKPAINVALNNSSIEELLNQTGSSEKLLEVHQSLNSNSIGELLSPIPGVLEKYPAGNKVLNNSSIDELLAPKADRSQRESFQPLTSNSTDELLNPKTATPIEGRLQPLNSNSIDELISPKTSNLTQSEVDLPPLTSSISLAKLLKEICVRA